MNQLPEGTVRHSVFHWVHANQLNIAGPVLELGSKLPSAKAWWSDFRGLLGLEGVEWVGTDMEAGPNVDAILDVLQPLPEAFRGRFKTVLACEVLEHLPDPAALLTTAWDALQPGGYVLTTSPWAFPYHAFPDDYFRVSPQALALLMSRVGFDDITTQFGHTGLKIKLDDHGAGAVDRFLPFHVYGRARRPA